MTSPERVAAAASTTTRWLGRLALVGAGLFVAGLAMDNESVAMPAAFLVVGSTVGSFTLPVGLALAVGLRRPAALPDNWRSAAALVGLASVLFGLRVMGAHLPSAIPTGVALIVCGGLAISTIARSPTPSSWQPPRAIIIAALGIGAVLWLVPKFDGMKTRAYFTEMQTVIDAAAVFEEQFQADSGRYAGPADSALAPPRGYATRLQIELTPDGYRAWTTSRYTTEGKCAVFIGTTPEPPATRPGIAACLPYPELLRTTEGLIWLAGIAVTTLLGIGISLLKPVA